MKVCQKYSQESQPRAPTAYLLQSAAREANSEILQLIYYSQIAEGNSPLHLDH